MPNPSKQTEKTEDLSEAIFAGANFDEDLPDAPGDRGDNAATMDPEPPAEPPAEPEPPRASEPEPAPKSEDPEPEPPNAEAAEPAPTPESPEPKDSEVRIPKPRFDEVNRRMKEAERRLAEYERKEREAARQAETPPFDFKAKEKEYMAAVLDGDEDKALGIREEIREAERATFRQEAEQTANKTTTQAQLRSQIESRVAEINRDYPVFDEDAAEFDPAISQDAIALYQGYVQQGQAPLAALNAAFEKTVRLHGLVTASAPAEPAPPAPKAQATEEQVRRKLDQATRQPPQPSTREAAPKPDLMRMPEEEFEKLSEAELRKLRGDLL